MYWDHWWDSFDLPIKVFLQTKDWGKGAGRWIAEAQTQRKAMDAKVLQQILMEVWMMNLLGDGGRPPQTTTHPTFGSSSKRKTKLCKATITLVRWREYPDIYHHNGDTRQTNQNTTGAQQKLHLLSVYIFLFAVSSILLHVRRDVQQLHNQVSWQVFPSLGLPEQDKLQSSDCGNSMVSSHGTILIPKENAGSLTSFRPFSKHHIPAFWFCQIIPCQTNQKRLWWRCHWHLSRKTQLAGRQTWPYFQTQAGPTQSHPSGERQRRIQETVLEEERRDERRAEDPWRTCGFVSQKPCSQNGIHVSHEALQEYIPIQLIKLEQLPKQHTCPNVFWGCPVTGQGLALNPISGDQKFKWGKHYMPPFLNCLLTATFCHF